MNKPQNGNGNGKGARTCVECGLRTANPATGLCFACEMALDIQTCKVPGCSHIAAPSGFCDFHELVARYEDWIAEARGARR